MSTLNRPASTALPVVRWTKRVGVQRYLRLLSRLSRMTPAEAAARGIQIPLKGWCAPADGRSPAAARGVPTPHCGRSIDCDWLTRRLDRAVPFRTCVSAAAERIGPAGCLCSRAYRGHGRRARFQRHRFPRSPRVRGARKNRLARRSADEARRMAPRTNGRGCRDQQRGRRRQVSSGKSIRHSI